MKDYPKISIVTVTYNCKDTIEKTICNVLKQTYPNIEYIVIDGASTDGTREIIERYADRLAFWISEPDKGIYDAMNKGIKAATGEWILFRNAGDYFFEPTTVQKVFEWYEDKGEVFITGGQRSFNKDGYRDFFYKKSDLGIWERQTFAHAATFIRLSVQKKNLYLTEFKIVSDLYFFMKMQQQNATFVVYDGIIALFEIGTGISTSENTSIRTLEENILAYQKLGAPSYKIKNTVRKRRKLLFMQRIMKIARLFPFIYQPYHKRKVAKIYTLQPLEVTLKNI